MFDDYDLLENDHAGMSLDDIMLSIIAEQAKEPEPVPIAPHCIVQSPIAELRVAIETMLQCPEMKHKEALVFRAHGSDKGDLYTEQSAPPYIITRFLYPGAVQYFFDPSTPLRHAFEVTVSSFVTCSGCIRSSMCRGHLDLGKSLYYFDSQFTYDPETIMPDYYKYMDSLERLRVYHSALGASFLHRTKFVDDGTVKGVSGFAGSGKTHTLWEKVRDAQGLRLVACVTNKDVLKFATDYNVPILSMPNTREEFIGHTIFEPFLGFDCYKRFLSFYNSKRDSSGRRLVTFQSVENDVAFLLSNILNRNQVFVGTLSSVHKFYKMLFRDITLSILALDEVSQMRWIDGLLVLSIRYEQLFVAGDLCQMYPVDIVDRFVFSVFKAYQYYPSFLNFLIDVGISLDLPARIDRRLDKIDAEQVYHDFYFSHIGLPFVDDYVRSTRYRVIRMCHDRFDLCNVPNKHFFFLSMMIL